jgi:hypothetical protein
MVCFEVLTKDLQNSGPLVHESIRRPQEYVWFGISFVCYLFIIGLLYDAFNSSLYSVE